MQRGVLYLVTIMDWFSRKVFAWQLSNSVDAVLCVEALKETLAKYGAPEIHNTDEGSQVTSGDWADVLTDVKVRISRDGKGGWIKNCMIERLRRCLKDECVYLYVLERLTSIGWYREMDGILQHRVSSRDLRYHDPRHLDPRRCLSQLGRTSEISSLT